MVWLNGQESGTWKIVDKEILRRAMCKDLSQWENKQTKSMKTVTSYAHQRVISSIEDLNNDVESVTHSMNNNQSLSPDTSVIAKRAHEQSGHHDRDGHYAWAMAIGECLIC